MKKNILVTGSGGQLGSELRFLETEFEEYRFLFTSSADLDICNFKAVQAYVEDNNIDSIINCAAYTAVDNAENEPMKADEVNHQAVLNLAKIARSYRIQLIHISTDYVFCGHNFKPYLVTDKTAPKSVYGKTKLAGEEAMMHIEPERSMIIRTSWVYSSFGSNFVKTMLQLGETKTELDVVCDQIGCPTYARDLASFILNYAISYSKPETMVYHYSNEGACSWYDFAKEIMEKAGKACVINPIPSSEYPTRAKRPYYSLLDKNTLKRDFGVKIPYWKESLNNCISIINES